MNFNRFLTHAAKIMSVFIVISLLMSSSGSVPLVMAQSALPKSGGGGPINAENVKSLTSAYFNYQYLLLKLTVAVQADGRGDVIVQQNIRNTDTFSGNDYTWYFDWPSGTYSDIRAWDATGPLEYSTSQTGTRIFVTVFFRRPLQPNRSYDFSFTTTIANMASGTGNNWNAAWYWAPYFPVQEFTQVVDFPSNSTIQSIDPAPTTRNFNRLEWRYLNTPYNWIHSINVGYTLSNSVSVPLFFQSPPATWAGNAYGDSSIYPESDQINTINKWGCWMTSAAMIVDYWGQRSSPTFRTNPGLLNSWLRNHAGYSDRLVKHSKIVEYAIDNHVALSYEGVIRGINDSVLNNYLSSGNPVIMGVDVRFDAQVNKIIPHHWVVATGKIIQNGQTTYSINDPLYGATTLLTRWQNKYSDIVLYSSTLADHRSLTISAHSPVELVITDPMGRKSGFDPRTQKTWNEIPNATYAVQSIAPDDGSNTPATEDKVLEIISPLDGNYTIDVIGTGQGSYKIDTFASDWFGDISNKESIGSAELGSVDSEVVNFSSYSGVGSNADIQTEIAGNNMDDYHIPLRQSVRVSYLGVNNGPVRILSTNSIPIISAERVIYKVNSVNTSFSEMMGLPNSQLDTTYWLPWYNNKDLDTQLRFANVSNTEATVHVTIGGTEMTGSPYTLAPGASTRKSFPGIDKGPVKIESNVNIVAAERVIYKVNGVNTSFSEMMALPNSQLDNIYWLPWYNNVGLDTQLRIANVSDVEATVHVTIGGTEMTGSPYTLTPGASKRLSYPGIDKGPVKIESNVDIVAAERLIYKVSGVPTSFSEMMALPNSHLDTTYWLPWYNNKSLDTQLRFANVSNMEASVHVTIGGVEMIGSPFTLLPGQSTRRNFPGIDRGPVKIESNVDIVVAERVIYKVNNVNASFSEMMALPASQLDTIFWLPWYNNVDLDTQLRFGVP